MEYVPSRSLHQVIAEDGPLPPARRARIGLDVLDALTAAHRAGVLHRDVKPHNVLIGDDGRVVLTDFGLATFVDDGSVTGPGLVVGSPQYVSPERARDGASTVESDLWSLGATLYAAVEGRSPYARESAMATLTALATEPPDPAGAGRPAHPGAERPAAARAGRPAHRPRRWRSSSGRSSGPPPRRRWPAVARPPGPALSRRCAKAAASACERASDRVDVAPEPPASAEGRAAAPPFPARCRPGRPGAPGPARRRRHRLSDAARRRDAAVGRPDRRRRARRRPAWPGPARSAASARSSATAEPGADAQRTPQPGAKRTRGEWTLVSGFSYFTDIVRLHGRRAGRLDIREGRHHGLLLGSRATSGS